MMLSHEPVRILITGSQGMLGTEWTDFLAQHHPDVSVLGTDFRELDITNSFQVAQTVKEYRPHWIINSAAYTEVDKAETDRDVAYQLNVLGPQLLAEAASKVNARLIHFSTDYVFNGSGHHAWTEKDAPNPLPGNWYGQTKKLGEDFVLQESSNLIFRIQWLYGQKKERFSILKTRTEFTPFIDQFGAPTWTRDIVKTCFEVMKRGGNGLFHFAYDDFASWYDVYDFVKKEWNLAVQLKPKKSDEVQLPAKRPLNGRLCNEKLKNFLGVSELGSWRASLKTFLGTLNND